MKRRKMGRRRDRFFVHAVCKGVKIGEEIPPIHGFIIVMYDGSMTDVVCRRFLVAGE
jgi:hypothetical protein